MARGTPRAFRAFEHPAEDAGVHEARERFLHAVHRVQPGVSRDLMGEPLALYRPIYRAWEARRPAGQGWSMALDWGGLPGWTYFKYAIAEHDPPAYVELRDALLKWSGWWRLVDDWCLEATVETLASLSGDDAPTPGPLYYLGARMIEMPFPEEATRFSFQCRGWQPTLENWETAREWIEEAFQSALAAHKDCLEALARAEGLITPRRPRDRAGDHLEWLARYVVGRETTQEIADAEGISRQAVDKAIAGAEHKIDLATPKRQTPLSPT